MTRPLRFRALLLQTAVLFCFAAGVALAELEVPCSQPEHVYIITTYESGCSQFAPYHLGPRVFIEVDSSITRPIAIVFYSFNPYRLQLVGAGKDMVSQLVAFGTEPQSVAAESLHEGLSVHLERCSAISSVSCPLDVKYNAPNATTIAAHYGLAASAATVQFVGYVGPKYHHIGTGVSTFTPPSSPPDPCEEVLSNAVTAPLTCRGPARPAPAPATYTCLPESELDAFYVRASRNSVSSTQQAFHFCDEGVHTTQIEITSGVTSPIALIVVIGGADLDTQINIVGDGVAMLQVLIVYSTYDSVGVRVVGETGTVTSLRVDKRLVDRNLPLPSSFTTFRSIREIVPVSSGYPILRDYTVSFGLPVASGNFPLPASWCDPVGTALVGFTGIVDRATCDWSVKGAWIAEGGVHFGARVVGDDTRPKLSLDYSDERSLALNGRLVVDQLIVNGRSMEQAIQDLSTRLAALEAANVALLEENLMLRSQL